MKSSSTIIVFVARCLMILLFSIAAAAQNGAKTVSGTVLDPAGRPVVGAAVELNSTSGAQRKCTTGSSGGFAALLPEWGSYTVRVHHPGFAPVTQKIELNAETAFVVLRLERVAAVTEEVVVNGDVSEIDLDAPDPSQKVLVREQLLDANPGRPGAPISIPGLPIETAAGGIKAPQYFVARRDGRPRRTDRAVHRGRRLPGHQQPLRQRARQRLLRPQYLRLRRAGRRDHRRRRLQCARRQSRAQPGGNLHAAAADDKLRHPHRRLSRH